MNRDSTKTVSTRFLIDKGMDWVLADTFLSSLCSVDQPLALEGLLGRAALKVFGEGDEIASQNGINEVHIVLAGRVLIQKQGPDKRHFTSVDVEEGFVAGLDSPDLASTPEQRIGLSEPSWSRVIAASHVQTLAIPLGALKAAAMESPELRSAIRTQADVMSNLPKYVSILSQNPILRLMGSDDIERLLLSSTIVSFDSGDHLMRAGDVPERICVVVQGCARTVIRNGAVEQPVDDRPVGSLVCHEPSLLGRGLSLEALARGPTKVLAINRKTFWEALQRNPLAHRTAMADLATRGLVKGAGGSSSNVILTGGRGGAVFVGAAESGLGVTTLAWGLAGRLALDSNLRVTLVDLEGSETCDRLGLANRLYKVKTGDATIAARRVSPGAGRGFDVIWPQRNDQEGELVKALLDPPRPGRILIVCGRLPTGNAIRPALEASDAVIVVRRPGDRIRVRTGRQQGRFQAIRITLGGQASDPGFPYAPIPLSEARRAVRIPTDPESTAAFWTSGRLPLGDDTVLGRACGRLERMLRGRAVGVALGGGGALGLAHVGLLEALHEAEIPVDFVAGVSFGSVVGALYVAGQTPQGGIAMLRRLVEINPDYDGPARPEPTTELKKLNKAILDAPLKGTGPVGKWVETLTGGLRMAETEIPFYPLGMNVTTGREFVLPDGTLGLAVQSASCMPGIWPALEVGPYRIVDGGVISNVPVSTVWESGADFILASNPINSEPGALHPPVPELLEWLVPSLADLFRNLKKHPLLDRNHWLHLSRLTGFDFAAAWERKTQNAFATRLGDMVLGMHSLMAQNGRDRSLMADIGFDFEMRDVEVYDFMKAGEIAGHAYRQARQNMQRIVDSYVNDVSKRF